jgi:hypothetical protein
MLHIFFRGIITITDYSTLHATENGLNDIKKLCTDRQWDYLYLWALHGLVMLFNPLGNGM